MSVKGLDTRQELAVVADRDEHLDVRAHGGLEDGEGAGGELVLLELSNLVLSVRGHTLAIVVSSRGWAASVEDGP